MGFWKRLTGLFSGPGQADSGYWITVQCNRCGETVRALVNLANDLSVNYGENDETTGYYCHKGLMGDGRCYQVIEVELTFDANRRLINREISGGKFVDEKQGAAA